MEAIAAILGAVFAIWVGGPALGSAASAGAGALGAMHRRKQLAAEIQAQKAAAREALAKFPNPR